jgi:hypothetical protein
MNRQSFEATTAALRADDKAGSLGDRKDDGRPERKRGGANRQMALPWRRWPVFALGVVLLVVLALAAGWLFVLRPSPLEPSKAELPTAQLDHRADPSVKGQSPASVTPQPQSGKSDDGMGKLLLQTKVAKALVLVDGKFAGLTGDDGDVVLAATRGPHKIRLSKSGFENLAITEVFDAGGVQHAKVQLSAQIARSSTPMIPEPVPTTVASAKNETEQNKANNALSPITLREPPKTRAIANDATQAPLDQQPASPVLSESSPTPIPAARQPPLLAAPADVPTNAQPRVSPEAGKGISGRAIRTFKSGQMVKVQGVILSRQGDLWKLRIDDHSIGTLNLSHATKILLKSGVVFRHTTRMDLESLVPGLHIEAQGRGNDKGELLTDRVSFDPNSMRSARQIDARDSTARAKPPLTP